MNKKHISDRMNEFLISIFKASQRKQEDFWLWQFFKIILFNRWSYLLEHLLVERGGLQKSWEEHHQIRRRGLHIKPEYALYWNPWKPWAHLYFQNPWNALLLKTWKPWKRYILILLWIPRIFSFGNHAIYQDISSLITVKRFLMIIITTWVRFSFQKP